MQNVAFTHSRAVRGQKGAANSVAAEFQVSSKGCEIGLSQGAAQSKAAKKGLAHSRVWASSLSLVACLSLISPAYAGDCSGSGSGHGTGEQEVVVEKVEVVDGATYTGDLAGLTVKSGQSVTIQDGRLIENLIIENGGIVNNLTGRVEGKLNACGEEVENSYCAKRWVVAPTGRVKNSGTIKTMNLKVDSEFYNYATGLVEEIAGFSHYAKNTTGSFRYTFDNIFHNYGTVKLISDFEVANLMNGGGEDPQFLNYAGSSVKTIAGGNFATFKNDGSIGDINGANKAVSIAKLTNNNSIGTIGGGANAVTIKSFSNNAAGASVDEIKNGATITKFNNAKGATIERITGGNIAANTLGNQFDYDGYAANGYIVENAGKIGEISGGTFGFSSVATGTVAEKPRKRYQRNVFTNTGEIGKISGGVFNTFDNKGIINEISGGEFKTGAYTADKRGTTATIIPKNSGTIAKIANAKFEALENSGKIGDIANTTITTLTNASGGEISISGVLTGDITNSGTVNFAMKTADNLGQLKGNLTNSGGTVNVDVKGATLAKQYTLITGEATGLDSSSFSLNSPNSAFLTATHSDDYKTITINKSQAFDEYKEQLGQTGSVAEKLLTSGVDIVSTSAISDTETTIKQSYIATPQQLISNFKANSVNNTPLGQGFGAVFTPTASQSKPTANADLLRFDNGYVVNSLVNEPKMEFFANPFLGELRGNGVKGSLGGVSLGLGYLNEGYALQGSFTYAYADSSQDLATQSTDTTAYMFQVGLLGQLFFADLVEIDINANYLLGKFKMSNIWLADSSLNSSSKFDNHQGNVGVAAGLRFGSEFSIKPFVGLQNYFESQGKYSVLGFESEKYSDYALNGVAGIEGRAKIGDLSFLYARVSGEFNFVESQKELFMVNKELNAELKYANETYKNSVSAGLGAQIFATDSVKLSIEGLYKYHDSGLNYYGGSLGVRVAF